MSEMIKIYSDRRDVFIDSKNIEAIIIVDLNSWSKDDLKIKMKNGDTYPIRENFSDFRKRMTTGTFNFMKIYSDSKTVHLNPFHLNSIKRIEANTFSKDELKITMKSGDSYTILENLLDFEKRVKDFR